MSIFLRSLLLSPSPSSLWISSAWRRRCLLPSSSPATATAFFLGGQQGGGCFVGQQQQQQQRWKHSKRQIKRLMAPHHPAYIRIHGRPAPPKPLPPPQFPPLGEPGELRVKVLPNGWTKPLDAGIVRPSYPFTVGRTKNKPLDTIGFLPVYSKLRKDGTKVITRIKKVTGDRDAFVQKVQSVLGIPSTKPIRISAGGTIEIPGAYVQKVKRWLTSLGF